MKNIGIIGAGSWGLALGKLLNENGHNVTLWTNSIDDIKEFEEKSEIKKYLPNIKFDKKIKITNDKELVVKNMDIVITALPSAVLGKVLLEFKNYFKEDQVIINVAKGFDPVTKERLSLVIKKIVPQCNVAVLSGPSHAEEVAKQMYTAIVIAIENVKIQQELTDVFSNDYFRVYGNTDVVGVEIGSALKNIIALAVGVTDGLGQGDNLIAALMTRSMVEVVKLGLKMGANPITFIGLTGFGDLVVTCNSVHSRNRRAGKLLGQGYSLDEVKKEVGMVIESLDCLKIAKDIIDEHKIDAPIINSLYDIVFCEGNAEETLKKLMSRSNKFENESFMF